MSAEVRGRAVTALIIGAAALPWIGLILLWIPAI